MGPRCIFFAVDLSPACQLLEALGLDDLAEDDRALLQQHFCAQDKFKGCPLFRLFERGLADKHLRLGRQQRAGETDSNVARSDIDTSKDCHGALC
jgi:hypothetical protein